MSAADQYPTEVDVVDQTKPVPDVLLRWAMGLPTPELVRANGQQLADDLDRLYPPRRARIDWGAVNCVVWAVVLVVVASVVIVGCIS